MSDTKVIVVLVLCLAFWMVIGLSQDKTYRKITKTAIENGTIQYVLDAKTGESHLIWTKTGENFP